MAPQATAVSLSNAVDTASSPDGVTVGQAGSAVGFYGTTPVAQPIGNNQVAITRGAQGGVISTYGTTQSPSPVSLNTTAEQSLTVQAGTGAQMLIASGDILYVNKPGAQAGLTYGNARYISSNVLGLTYGNATGSTITPTASDIYSVVGIRGVPKLSLTASPAAVAANTTVEQTFALTGLQTGHLVQVSKPTAQAGLDILGCRIVSNNVLGITFGNYTSSAITPTASEVYTCYGLAGLDAVGNDVMYGFDVGTVNAIGLGVVASTGNTTLTGMLATDVVVGIFDPTAQAATSNAAFPIKGIPTANVLSLYFAGIGLGATPTAGEVYGIATKRLAPAAPLVNYSVALTPGSVAANTSAEQTFTVTGLISGTPVWVNKPSYTPGLGIGGVRVSGTNTLAITYVNLTSAAIVPPSENYVVGNFQVPTPGANNSVYQHVSPIINNLGNLANGTRTALVNEGLMAGG